MQRSRKDLYKAVEGRSTKHIVFSVITGSFSRRRSHWTIFEPEQTKFIAHFTLLSLVCRIDHRRKPGERFLQKHILFISPIWTKLRRFLKMFFEGCAIRNLVSKVLKWIGDSRMGILSAITTASKSYLLRNINTVRWESRNITSNQGKLTIGNPKLLRLS